MRIVIPGGTGQLGTLLAQHWFAQGHDVWVFGRSVAKPAGPWSFAPWDAGAGMARGEPLGSWAAAFDGADVVVNLAGRSVDCRYTTANRRAILDSRVTSTRAVGAAIAQAQRPPRVWLQASTATIYAHRYDAGNDEATGRLGGDEAWAPSSWRFSIDVARAWEAAALAVPLPHTRTVLLRSAMVMHDSPGAVFDVLSRLTRVGLGGRCGDGRQFVSWIHGADFARALDWILAHDELAGAVNVSAPNPLPYAAFARALRQAHGVWLGLPAPAWLVELGTFVLRTESELVLKSRRVVPGRLLASGFSFRYPEWPAAAADLAMARRARLALKPPTPSAR